MTRINTNVSSLNAQKTLARSNSQLQSALTRLSTGLRINSGKDDPSGLIASEALRSDIVATQKAISNSDRANQIIGTADSALGQVSSLLNDIRGLVTEAANKGAMSDDQIAANQLQVDASLEALNRIAQSTSFQGRRLLDGSLDFVVQQGAGMSSVSDMQVDSAILPASGTLAVNVDVTSAATQAKLTNTGFTAGTAATTTFAFAAGGKRTGHGGAGVLEIMSNSLTSGAGVTIKFEATGVGGGAGTATVAYTAPNEITIDISTAGAATSAYLAGLINNSTDANIKQFYAVGDATATSFDGQEADLTLVAETLKIDAVNSGADYNNVSVAFNVANVGATPTATYDASTRQITVTIDDNVATTLANIEAQIDLIKVNGAAIFNSSIPVVAGSTRAQIYGSGGADRNASGNTGASGGNALKGDVVFQLSSDQGSQVYQFKSGTTVDQIVKAINLQSDATGVAGSYTIATGAATLNMLSSSYGSAGYVAADVISEAASGTFKVNLSAQRATGTNIAATINGFTATGDGNTLSINTASLAMKATVANGSSSDFSFNITGGGALFQLGPDVVTTQQARIGISSVNTSKLGGPSGRLYLLGSGQSAALKTDVTTAGKIVDDVVGKIAGLRGRLGALQRTTIDNNSKTLQDTLENLTGAESQIRDADFASESANMTRAQVLVQSGTSVLAIANQSPQNVLALLRG